MIGMPPWKKKARELRISCDNYSRGIWPLKLMYSTARSSLCLTNTLLKWKHHPVISTGRISVQTIALFPQKTKMWTKAITTNKLYHSCFMMDSYHCSHFENDSKVRALNQNYKIFNRQNGKCQLSNAWRFVKLRLSNPLCCVLIPDKISSFPF